jgi:hypothetical protein
MKCRKRSDDIKTGVESLPRDEPGGYLSTDQVVSGMKAARAWFRLWYGAWEPDPRYCPVVHLTVWSPGWRERDLQVAATTRGRVAVRGTGANRLVVAVKFGNAGGAKGAGCPGRSGGQL